jgi:uncharacterized membrane protein HdeD (DUF308 family)
MEKTMTESMQMPMCPMAKTCKGMMDKPFSGFMIVIPGIFLIVLGLVVLVEPRVLVWLMAAVLVVMGVAMLMIGRVMRKFRKRIQSTQE